MQVIADILLEVRTRVSTALGIALDRVLDHPKLNDLPDDEDPFAAVRCTLDQGRTQTFALDGITLSIDIAAYLAEPTLSEGQTVSGARLAIAGAVHAALTPCNLVPGSLPIEGWKAPVMVRCLVEPNEDIPDQLFIGMTIQGDVTLGRAGYGS